MKHLAILAVAGLSLILGQSCAKAATPAPKPPQFAPSDFRTIDPQNALVIDTEKGRIIVEMYPEISPLSVARIKTLARLKFYDGLIFHRVIDSFMDQGGDPKGDGSGGSDQPNVPGEFAFKRGVETNFVAAISGSGPEDGFVKALPVRSQNSDLMVMTADGKVSAWGRWCPGVTGMARGGDPNSANSQFFLMRQYNADLERNYTPWGRVVVGLDVVRSIAAGEPPPVPDHMKSVRILADLPNAPKVQVADANSAAFQALIAYTKAQRGGLFSVCDVQLPSRTE